jgi:predicted heme/steroid binding protein
MHYNSNLNINQNGKGVRKQWNKFPLAAPMAFLLVCALFFSFTGLSCATANATSPSTISDSNNVVTSSVQIQDEDSTEKVFTREELAKYDGKDGMPAYVAVDGLVYDLSRIFREGTHFEHVAGQELTDAFYSYHAKREIIKYPIVGTYES